MADDDYNSVRQRERIQYIGYEVDRATLSKRSVHFFKFDRLSRQILEQYYAERRDVQFLVRATTALKNGKNTQVSWRNEPSEHQQPELLIQFVERPRTAPPSPSDVKVIVDNGVARITWQLAESDDVVGAMVVIEAPPAPDLEAETEELIQSSLDD